MPYALSRTKRVMCVNYFGVQGHTTESTIRADISNGHKPQAKAKMEKHHIIKLVCLELEQYITAIRSVNLTLETADLPFGCWF